MTPTIIGTGRLHPKPRRCAHCGHESEVCWGPLGSPPPAPGSLSVCVHCHSVSVYSPDLTLVPANELTLPDDLRRAALHGAERTPEKETPK